MIRFTSCIILRVCVDTLWPKPKNRLPAEGLEPFDPIKILAYGLQHMYPATITNQLVRHEYDPVGSSFQQHYILPSRTKD